MNKKKRMALKIERDWLDAALDRINGIKDGENESFDNLPEPLQSSELGERLQAAAEALERAAEAVQETIDCLDEAAEL